MEGSAEEGGLFGPLVAKTYCKDMRNEHKGMHIPFGSCCYKMALMTLEAVVIRIVQAERIKRSIKKLEKECAELKKRADFEERIYYSAVLKQKKQFFKDLMIRGHIYGLKRLYLHCDISVNALVSQKGEVKKIKEPEKKKIKSILGSPQLLFVSLQQSFRHPSCCII